METETESKILDDTYISAIQREYTQIDGKWLKLHYRIMVGAVFFAFVVELVMGIALRDSSLVTISVPQFFLKYLVAPSGINLTGVTIVSRIMKSERFSQIRKIYAVSLSLVCICFVLFTVHIIFAATYFIFAIAIMLTTVYADYRITSITAAVSIFAMVISELFITWDTDKVSVFQNTYQMGNFLISLFVLIAFSVIAMVIVHYEKKKNSASIQKELERKHLKKSILLDEMTGIYNRRAFREKMREVEENMATEHYLLAMVDVDKFKDINDTWGHHVGDVCLIEFAKLLKAYNADITSFRYGGDEFCLLFYGVDMAYAKTVCADIQVKVKRMYFKEYPGLRMTASFGLTESTEQKDTMGLVTHADHALYEAKKVRNAIRVF